MTNTVNITTLMEGPRHVIVHVYIKSDGVEGEVVDQLIVDPATLVPPQAAVAKFDIEGAEERALMGARSALTDCAYIVTELNPFGQSQCGSSEQSLRRLMRGMPYAREMFLLHDSGALPSQVPQDSVIEYDLGGSGVKNVLFSTNYDVGKLWPKVPCEIE